MLATLATMSAFSDMHYYRIEGHYAYYVGQDTSYASQLKNGLLIDELIMAECMSPFPFSASESATKSLEIHTELYTPTHTQMHANTPLDDMPDTVCKGWMQKGAITRKSSSKKIKVDSKKQKRIYSNRRKSDYVKKAEIIGEEKYEIEIDEPKHELYIMPFYSNLPEFILCENEDDSRGYECLQIFKHVSKKLIVIVATSDTYHDTPVNWDEEYPGYDNVYIEKCYFECMCWVTFKNNLCYSCKKMDTCKMYKKYADELYIKKEGVLSYLKITENAKTILEMDDYMQNQKYFKFNEYYDNWKFNYTFKKYEIHQRRYMGY